METRYTTMFERLRAEGSGAFIPFVMLGDPTPAASREVILALIEGGADALELGIPFSDPIADGPTVQRAAQRALEAGTTPDDAWAILREVRQRVPAIPIGLLVYANLVAHRGLDVFYGHAADAGVDSVLVADVPTFEADPFVAQARAHGVAPVLIAPPNADTSRLAHVAALSEGYTYVVTRAGVTGARDDVRLAHTTLLETLRAHDAPPAVFGFGISTPAHVRAALDAGASGAISGSAVVRHLEGDAPLDDVTARLRVFVQTMKAATR